MVPSIRSDERGRTAAMLAGLLALALALGACGSDDSGVASPDAVPDGAVAVIGDAQISERELDERVAALRRSGPGVSAEQRQQLEQDPGGRAQAKRQAEAQALSSLLMAKAIQQEAAERGISVSEADARARWRAVADAQFRTPRALRRFLGGQTERDVAGQLRVQMLSEAIYAQVAEQAGGGKSGRRAVERFQDEFRRRMHAETACREGLEAPGCQAPKQAPPD